MTKKRQGNRFAVPALAIAALLALAAFALLPDADSNVNEKAVIGAPGDYDVGDIAVINDMIDNNDLAWMKSPTDGSAVDPSWTGIIWDGASTGQRVTYVNLYDESLTGALDVTGLTALEYLDCYYNQIASLDVTGLTALESIDCGGNELTSLDLTGCSALKSLYCDSNKLTSLDVSPCPSLEELYCDNNKLASLTLTGLTALSILDCSYNELV